MTTKGSTKTEGDPDARSADIAAIRRLYGWGRTTVYELIQAGELETYYVGRRQLITIASADRYMAKLLKAANADRARARSDMAKRLKTAS